MKLPERDPCPFCEVVETGSRWTLDDRLVEAVVIADSDEALALLSDESADGYAFVISKRHAPTIVDLQPDESHAVMDLLVAVCRAIKEELAPDGINIVQNNGVAGGQGVPHVHFHLVPRREGDEWTPPTSNRSWGGRASLPERQALGLRLAARLKPGAAPPVR